MVALLDALERRGYTVRSRDPGDRRRHVVAMTPAGRVVFRAMTEAVDAFTGRLLGDLNDRERQSLTASLAKVDAAAPRGGAPRGQSLEHARNGCRPHRELPAPA
jgi:DNA-binding MarR family transcriptional regulator